MKVGFTGSQAGTTSGQLHQLRSWLITHDVEEFHHGCCVGADTMSHYEAYRLGPGLTIVYHPPTNTDKMSDLRNFPEVWRKPRSYPARNRGIVDETEILLAMPKGLIHEVCRHGTCYTVRYARSQDKEVVVFNRSVL